MDEWHCFYSDCSSSPCISLCAQNKALVNDCVWPASYHCTHNHLHHLILWCTKLYIKEHTCQHSFSLQPLFILPCFRHQKQKPLLCKNYIFSLSSLHLIFLHYSKWDSSLQNRQLCTFCTLVLKESFFITVIAFIMICCYFLWFKPCTYFRVWQWTWNMGF